MRHRNLDVGILSVTPHVHSAVIGKHILQHWVVGIDRDELFRLDLEEGHRQAQNRFILFTTRLARVRLLSTTALGP